MGDALTEAFEAARRNPGPLAAFDGRRPPAPEWFAKAIARTPESRTVMSGACPIHYLRWGVRGRAGLLLVHGNGAHARWWSFIAPYFAGRWNVAALDLSGMGESGWRESYGMDDFAAEQIAVMADAGFFEADEPPMLLGHSFGGFAAVVAAAELGDRLGGLVVADTPLAPREHHPGPPDRKARAHNVYPTLEQALARFRLAPPQSCENLYIVDWIARHSLKEVEGGFTWKFDPRIWERFKGTDAAMALGRGRTRMAMIYGEQSLLVTPKIVEYWQGALRPGTPVIAVPEAQHHLMLDQPLAFAAAVRALLEVWSQSGKG